MTSPHGLPDEAVLEQLGQAALLGTSGPGTSAPGGAPPGAPSTVPVGSPGVPGLPGAVAVAAPVTPPGLGGVAPSSTDLAGVRPPGTPDSATLAPLAAEPYGPGSPLVTPPAAGLPAGVPDEAMLLRMASAFFAAMPGAHPDLAAPGYGFPGEAPDGVPNGASPVHGVPTGGVPNGALGAAAPGRAVPTGGIPAGGASAGAVPSGALPPGSVPVEAPSEASDGRPAGMLSPADRSARPSSGGGSFDAPGFDAPGFDAPGYDTPGLEAVDAAPIAVPSTPYYVIGESAVLPGADLFSASRAGNPACPAYYFTHPAGLDGSGAQSSGVGSDRRAVEPDRRPFDVNAVRADFPILSEIVNGRPLVWLDNAATTQKPQAVIDRIVHFYAHENSNIHRAAHELAKRSTDAYEAARDKIARFLHAGSSDEIVFVRGTSEGINLVAAAWGRRHIGEGDEIVISHLEHHANIVPWQELCRERGARLRVIPVDDDGQVVLSEYTKLLSGRTKLVAVTQVSNALGTVVPIAAMVPDAHRVGAKFLVDGAQSVPHLRVDAQALDVDFFVFSGHKVFAPTGIGAVYGKPEVLESMTPYQTGGHMIRDVTLERSTFQDPPTRFEAGTGSIADAVGLGAALDYLERIGFDAAARYEHDLLAYGTEALRSVPGLRPVGTAADKASVLSFTLDGFRPAEVGEALDRDGIAVRSGHHCAQPILRRLGLEATVRPSLAFYNTVADVDALVASLRRLVATRLTPP